MTVPSENAATMPYSSPQSPLWGSPPSSSATHAKADTDRGAAAAAGAAKKKGGEDEDFGPIMQVSDKQRRVNEERALKTLKWNFDVPRKEFVKQLRNQIEAANWNKTLIGMIRQWA